VIVLLVQFGLKIVSGDLWYQMYDASGVEKIRIRPDFDSFFNGGNVGIGTTLPATKLHAVSGSGSGATGDSGYQIIADSSGIAGIQNIVLINTIWKISFLEIQKTIVLEC
jgi:hypothetical protein